MRDVERLFSHLRWESGTLSYALDSAITARKHLRKPKWDNHCLASPAEKLRWIELHAGLKNQNGNSIRLTIRLGSAKMLKKKQEKLKSNCQRSGGIRGEMYRHLLSGTWLGPATESNCLISGGIEGGMYGHLLSGLGVGGNAGSPSIRVEQLECSIQRCSDSADVRHGQPWTTPARGPP